MQYKPDLSDLIAISGLALLAGGLYFVYPPLALIVPGLTLLLVGLVAGWRSGGSN